MGFPLASTGPMYAGMDAGSGEKAGGGGGSGGGGGFAAHDHASHGFVFDKDLILKQTNKHRCEHGVQPLKWNDALAAHAQAYATETGGAMEHSSAEARQGTCGFDYVGENLFLGDAAMDLAVDAWYDEIQFTDNGKASDFDMCTGHYTQLVWRDTTDVGCGYIGLLLVCQYGPTGNMMGMFSQEVPERIYGKTCTGYEQPYRRLEETVGTILN